MSSVVDWAADPQNKTLFVGNVLTVTQCTHVSQHVAAGFSTISSVLVLHLLVSCSAGQLPENISVPTLRSWFEMFGDITFIQRGQKSETAFVTFAQKHCAAFAREAFQGAFLS